MSDKYDVAIIGAGIGGLMAGIDLQKSGLKTIILEKHSQPGGYCSSFKRNGYLFDVGVHMLTAVGNKQTVIGNYLNKLDLKINLLKYDYLDRIFFPDKTYNLSGQAVDLIEYLAGKFPQEKEALLKMFNNLKEVLVFYNNKQVFDLQKITYQKYLNYFFKNRELINIFGTQSFYLGLPPDQISAISMVFLLASMIYHGRYYPQGGTGCFSGALAAKYYELGGKLLLSSEVIATEVQNKCVSRLFYQKNSSKGDIKAKWFISNADAKQTLLNLIGRKYFDKLYLGKLKKYKTSYSGFSAYLGINAAPKDFYCQTGLHFNLKSLSSPKLTPYFIHTPKIFDSNLSPDGKQIAIINAKTNLQGCTKEQVLKYFLMLFQKNYPKIKDSIEIIETATPATFEKYTGNSKGAFYGWAALPRQSFNNSLANKTPLNNLFLAGHWSYPQAGILGVGMSGLQVSKKIQAIF